jgi:hypothetical protein
VKKYFIAVGGARMLPGAKETNYLHLQAKMYFHHLHVAFERHSLMTKMRLPEVQSSSRSGMQLHKQAHIQLFTLINQWSPADRLMWAQ